MSHGWMIWIKRRAEDQREYQDSRDCEQFSESSAESNRSSSTPYNLAAAGCGGARCWRRRRRNTFHEKKVDERAREPEER